MLTVTVYIEIDYMALLSAVLCILPRPVLCRLALIFLIHATMANISRPAKCSWDAVVVSEPLVFGRDVGSVVERVPYWCRLRDAADVGSRTFLARRLPCDY